jgi:hypothetical protein
VHVLRRTHSDMDRRMSGPLAWRLTRRGNIRRGGVASVYLVKRDNRASSRFLPSNVDSTLSVAVALGRRLSLVCFLQVIVGAQALLQLIAGRS